MHYHNFKCKLYAISVDFIVYTTHLTLQTKKYAAKNWMMYPMPQEFKNIISLLPKNPKNLLHTLQ